jgi:hypothetical protein
MNLQRGSAKYSDVTDLIPLFPTITLILHRARVLPGISILCNVISNTNGGEASHVRRSKSRRPDGGLFCNELAREMDDGTISRGCSLELVDAVILGGTSSFLTFSDEAETVSRMERP